MDGTPTSILPKSEASCTPPFVLTWELRSCFNLMTSSLSTYSGLLARKPSAVLLTVSAVAGFTSMARYHFETALGLGLPLFVAVMKTDASTRSQLTKTLTQITAALREQQQPQPQQPQQQPQQPQQPQQQQPVDTPCSSGTETATASTTVAVAEAEVPKDSSEPTTMTPLFVRSDADVPAAIAAVSASHPYSHACTLQGVVRAKHCPTGV